MEGKIDGDMFLTSNASVDSDVDVKGRSWRDGDSDSDGDSGGDDGICNDTLDSNGIDSEEYNEKGEGEVVAVVVAAAAVVVVDDNEGEDTGFKSIDILRYR